MFIIFLKSFRIYIRTKKEKEMRIVNFYVQALSNSANNCKIK